MQESICVCVCVCVCLCVLIHVCVTDMYGVPALVSGEYTMPLSTNYA